MKGIILAGGTGSRLFPSTLGITKHLLPIYDKPMIYYPLSVLMLSKIRNVLIITTREDHDNFVRLLGDGSHLGMNIVYEIQDQPNGLAQAFTIGSKFIKNDKVCLVLGDNIFWGHGLSSALQNASNNLNGAVIFGHQVKDPRAFGVVEFSDNLKVISIEEKPSNPKSNFAITGLYYYDNNVVDLAKTVKPSDRGELEITSINQMYLDQGRLKVELLGRGFAWLDTGTHENLMSASTFVEAIQTRQGYKIACIEEIAWRNGWIDKTSLMQRATQLGKTTYGHYLSDIANES